VFAAAYERANPDMQREHGYPVDAPGTANMTMCTNAIADRFQCPAYTLEMPFKDNANAPDPVFGWSPQRSALLGASSIDALLQLAEAFEETD
jgi:murein tripeptide amidase MpaA